MQCELCGTHGVENATGRFVSDDWMRCQKLMLEITKLKTALILIADPRPSMECPEFYAEASNLQRIATDALAESV